MYKHLKVGATSILNESRLTNLGKINIVCGKNNSGKTTLLRQLNFKNTVKIGGKFDQEVTELLVEDLTDGLSNNQIGSNGYSYRVKTYINYLPVKDVLLEIFRNQNVWFEDESESLINKFSDYLLSAAAELKRKEYDHNHEQFKVFLSRQPIRNQLTKMVNDIFQEFLNPQLERKDFFDPHKIQSSIFISPKRKMDKLNSLNSDQEVEADGSNLVSKLFVLRNQTPGSDEHNFYEAIISAFRKVSGDYQFFINVEEKGSLKLTFSNTGKPPWIPADECGLGLQDLLVLLYFALEPNNDLILIEEPENHLHPEMQRKLLRFLAEDTEDKKQFIISTHSNIFVNSTYVDKVLFTKFEDGKISVDDQTKQAEILHYLGYSVTDNLVSDLIILVEGPSDTPVIEEFIRKIGLDAKYNIKTWALGGDIMDKHDLSVFLQNYSVMAIVDNDPGSKAVRAKFIAKCEESNIPVTRLKRYSIENYFTERALKAIFKGQIAEDLELKPNVKLFDQIQIDVKKCNPKIAKAMELEEIQGTDLMDFFDAVKSKLEA